MANATINGVTFSDLTIEQVMALAQRFTPEPVNHSVETRVVEQVVAKASHKLACGHSVPKSRGRYPSACANCATPKTAKPRKQGSGRYSPNNWNSDHPHWNDPASEPQYNRIDVALSMRVVPAKLAKKYRRNLIERNLTAGRATEIKNDLRNMPFA